MLSRLTRSCNPRTSSPGRERTPFLMWLLGGGSSHPQPGCRHHTWAALESIRRPFAEATIRIRGLRFYWII